MNAKHDPIAVVDTHALIWLLEESDKLGKEALRVLRHPQATLILPVIVLCELMYWLRRKKNPDRYPVIMKHLSEDGRFIMKPLSADMVATLPEQLEMHDALIVAETRAMDGAVLLSCDGEIKKWGGCETVWN